MVTNQTFEICGRVHRVADALVGLADYFNCSPNDLETIFARAYWTYHQASYPDTTAHDCRLYHKTGELPFSARRVYDLLVCGSLRAA
jgi:hypothetical protein